MPLADQQYGLDGVHAAEPPEAKLALAHSMRAPSRRVGMAGGGTSGASNIAVGDRRSSAPAHPATLVYAT